MFTVLEIVVPVFVIIGLGYGIRRQGVVDDSFFSQINKLVYYICLPLLLFYKIGTADFSSSFNVRLVLAVGGSIAICFALSYLHGLWKKYPPQVQGVFCQGSFRGNLAYIGLAIIYNGYGDPGLSRAGVLLGFLVPILNLFAILALSLPRQQQTNYGKIGRDIISNPLIIASLTGIIWSFFQLPVPTILERTLKIATGMTLPLALISIGGSFSLEKLRGDLKTAALATTWKLILLPIIAGIMMLLFNIRGLDFAIGLLMAGAPTAVTTYIMSCQMGGDGKLAGAIVVMATGLSAISYTIMLYCLQVFQL
jgi:predicted permease